MPRREAVSPDLRVKKILVFRSARMEQINKIMDDLKEKYLKPEISILCQSEVVDTLQANPQINEVLAYGKGNFNLFKCDRSLLNKIKQKRFDLIVIPHNNEIGRGYFHVESIASLCGAKRVICYDLFLSCHSLNFGFRLWRILNIILNPLLKLLFLGYLKFQIWKSNKYVSRNTRRVS